MMEPPAHAPLLEVADLTVRYGSAERATSALDELSLTVAPGEVLALVGESGSGKTTLALALMGLLPPEARVAGRATLSGEGLLGPRERRPAPPVAMVFQEPAQALHPFWRVEALVAEPLRQRWGLSREQATAQARELLVQAGLSQPEPLLRAFPHQLSGGQQQRVLLAMALACRPRLLLCDEPTTALDAAARAEVLALLAGLARDQGLGVLLVSHDPAGPAAVATHVAVLYAGRLLELAPARDFFSAPAHPYSRALLACAPGAEGASGLPQPIPGPPASRCGAVGCAFLPRCGVATPHCHSTRPPLRPRAANPVWLMACHAEAQA